MERVKFTRLVSSYPFTLRENFETEILEWILIYNYPLGKKRYYFSLQNFNNFKIAANTLMLNQFEN